MIFTEIVIHNFGIYRGRHVVDLAPKSAEQPILLFGGLNGGGKTTFLDAMKLVLYGKLAECSNRGDLPYDQFLANTINRNCLPQEGAAIELEFTSVRSSEKTTIRIKRYWHKNKKTVSEKIEVLENGALSPILSEHWPEHVDDFIPQDIANLFFFDGEKIESLADKNRSASIIRTGIYSLLGLNTVDKLKADLVELDKRRTSAKTDHILSKQLDFLDQEIAQLEDNRERLLTKIAEKNSQLDKIELKLQQANKTLQASGGDFYSKRGKYQRNLEVVEASLANNMNQMLELASGIAPLCLLKDLLHTAKLQCTKERQAKNHQIFNNELRERDKDLVKHIFSTISEEVSKKVYNWLQADLKKRDQDLDLHTYLNCDPNIFDCVREPDLKATEAVAEALAQEHAILEDQRTVLEQQLAAVPEESEIAPIIEQVDQLEKEKSLLHAKIALLDEELENMNGLHGDLKERRVKLTVSIMDSDFEDQRVNLLNRRSKLVSKTLDLYRVKVLASHISRLESLIFESFTSLARKSSLLSKVEIDPETFEITVFDADKLPLPTDRLSAGERQLFAVSILWGLAKASGCPLPSIVDTPLGRLDSKHRTHLVENYFPRASHQVILLSTDEEIDQRYREKLSKYIGKEYHIEYSQEAKTSTISPGYF